MFVTKLVVIKVVFYRHTLRTVSDSSPAFLREDGGLHLGEDGRPFVHQVLPRHLLLVKYVSDTVTIICFLSGYLG